MMTTASQALLQCLGWTLVHFLWQGLAIAVWLGLCLHALRRNPANHRYLAGCAALLLMVASPLLTFNRLVDQLPAPQPRWQRAPAPMMATRHALPLTIPIIEPSPRTVNLVRGPAKPSPLSLRERWELALPWLALLWAAGVVAFGIQLLAGWFHVRRSARDAGTLLEEPWATRLAELAERLGLRRSVRLVQSALVEVPATIGWLRPVILLPAGCLTGLSPSQLDAILAHELAHIRRHDYLVNLLQCAVETLLFYHPAVWWASGRIREAREFCCDDLAVAACGNRVAYARALATLEELRPASLALAASGAPLLQRIRRLTARPPVTTGPAGWLATGVVTLLAVTVLLAALPGNRVWASAGDVLQLAQNLTPSQAFARTNRNLVHTSKGRQAIMAKLDAIPVDYALCDEMPLRQVVEQLSRLSQARDPDRQGINFMLLRQSLPLGEVDPVTGAIVPVNNSDLPEVGAVLITIKPEMRGLRLHDLLEIIVRSASAPIRYTVEDYAVAFHLTADPAGMYTRIFHVDPNTFIQGLENVTGIQFSGSQAGGNGSTGGGGGGGNSGGGTGGTGSGVIIPGVQMAPGGGTGAGAGANGGGTGGGATGGGVSNVTRSTPTTNTQAVVRQFFGANGVDFNPTGPGGTQKLIFLDERNGTLMVHAPLEDLQKVGTALEKLSATNAAPITNAVPGTNQPAPPKRKPDGANAAPAANKEILLAMADSGGNTTDERRLIAEARANRPPSAPVPAATEPGDGLPNHPQPSGAGLTDFALADSRLLLDNAARRQSLQLQLEENIVALPVGKALPLALVLGEIKQQLPHPLAASEEIFFRFAPEKEKSPAKAKEKSDPASRQPESLAEVKVTLAPGLGQRSLRQALELICAGANPPLMFAIADDGIVLARRGAADTGLQAHTYRLTTAIFLAELERVTAPIPWARFDRQSTNHLRAPVEQYLASVGIDAWETNRLGLVPKMADFNPNNGELSVRLRSTEITRLGEVLDRSGLIAQTPAKRTKTKGLSTMIFRVEVPVLLQEMERVSSRDSGLVKDPDPTARTQRLLDNYLATVGVNLSEPGDAAGTKKAAFFSALNGTLLVRATAADLARVGEIVKQMNTRGASATGSGQASYGDLALASREALHRQADVIELQQTLTAARKAENQQDFATAARLYEAGYLLAQRIGTQADNESRQIIAGLGSVQFELARRFQQQHDYTSADERLRRLLALDPENVAARALFEANQGLLTAQNTGRSLAPATGTNTLQAAALVQNAKRLIGLGRLAEAGAELEQALKLDPEDDAAVNFLRMVRERMPAVVPVAPAPPTPVTNNLPAPAAPAASADSDQTNRMATGEIPTGESMITRTFKLDYARLRNGLIAATGKSLPPENTTNKAPEITAALRQYLTAAGVDFSTNSPANVGKAIFYNHRKGMLFVHAPPSDLEVIAAAVEALGYVPPQVNLKLKVAEVDPDRVSPAALQALLATTGATFSTNETAAIPLPNFAGATNMFHDPDRPMTNAARQQFFGELTEPQTRQLQVALSNLPPVTWWEGPEITTATGRDSRLQRLDALNVATGVTATGQKGGTGTNAPGVNYQTQGFACGLSVNIHPTVAADSYTIPLSIGPTLTEFVGYDDPANFTPIAASVNGHPITLSDVVSGPHAVVPLPRFRVSQLALDHPGIWDGRTLLAGGLISESVIHFKDKVPYLGDVPLMGQLFTKESSSKQRKLLLLFITPTLINPDGSRFHTDGDMPWVSPNRRQQRKGEKP